MNSFASLFNTTNKNQKDLEQKNDNVFENLRNFGLQTETQPPNAQSSFTKIPSFQAPHQPPSQPILPVATQSPVFQALQQPISLAQSTVAQKPVFQAFQPLIQQPAPQPIPQASRLKSLLSPQPVPQKGINVIPALQAIVEPQSESTSSISTWQKSPIESNIKTQVEEMQVEELPPSPSEQVISNQNEEILEQDLSGYFISETQKLLQSVEQLTKSFESFDEILADLNCRLSGENYTVLHSHHQIKEILEEYSSTLSSLSENMVLDPPLSIKNHRIEDNNEEQNCIEE